MPAYHPHCPDLYKRWQGNCWRLTQERKRRRFFNNLASRKSSSWFISNFKCLLALHLPCFSWDKIFYICHHLLSWRYNVVPSAEDVWVPNEAAFLLLRRGLNYFGFRASLYKRNRCIKNKSHTWFAVFGLDLVRHTSQLFRNNKEFDNTDLNL